MPTQFPIEGKQKNNRWVIPVAVIVAGFLILTAIVAVNNGAKTTPETNHATSMTMCEEGTTCIIDMRVEGNEAQRGFKPGIFSVEVILPPEQYYLYASCYPGDCDFGDDKITWKERRIETRNFFEGAPRRYLDNFRVYEPTTMKVRL